MPDAAQPSIILPNADATSAAPSSLAPAVPDEDVRIRVRDLTVAFGSFVLTLYADLMGIIGGFLVGTTMLRLNPMEYINATIQMVPFKHLIIGLVYGTVFGAIVAVAGCYQGIRCGRSAQAVGQATTTAVVQAIVGIIVATAIITVICNVLDV